MLNKQPHEVDVFVGRNIRSRRAYYGLSQTELAKKLGITFQQLQKYESGANRVSASRLWHIAQELKMPVAEFFPKETTFHTPIEEATRGDINLLKKLKECPPSIKKEIRALLNALAKESE